MRTIGRAVMKTVVMLLVLGGVVSSASAFKEPAGFRGVPWGASEDALRDMLATVSCVKGSLVERGGATWCLS
jgi:hypothetical protein